MIATLRPFDCAYACRNGSLNFIKRDTLLVVITQGNQFNPQNTDKNIKTVYLDKIKTFVDSENWGRPEEHVARYTEVSQIKSWGQFLFGSIFYVD